MADLSLGQMIALSGALAPMSGEIQSAFAELQKIEADPNVKEAILTAEKYLADPAVKAATATLQKVASTVSQVLGGQT